MRAHATFRPILLALPLLAFALPECNSGVQGIATGQTCSACVASSDCPAADVCGILVGGAFCAESCQSDSDCTSGQVCGATKSAEGTSTHVCTLPTGSCSAGTSPDAGGPDDGGGNGTDAGQSTCGGYAAPDVSGTGCSCGSGHTCTANNCYGGYYCETSTNKCVAPPSNCTTTTTDGGMMQTPDAGLSGFTSTITASGGSESQLFFAVVGDTRPYNEGDSTNYPATPPLPACTSSNAQQDVGTDNANCGAITTIFTDVQNMNPSPPFVISTGDYQYVTPGSGDSMTQLGYYQTARNLYSGIEWPAMGNHECDGYTASNCATGCPAGDTCSGSNTENFLGFQSLFLQPIGETLPYYTRTVTATDSSWTAHFIVVAPNYWDSTQQTWLTSQLAAAGTSSTSNYIFVIHHEDATAGDPSSLNTIESAESSVETVSIVGHSHTWAHGGSNPKELLVGNGGVPSTSLNNLGFTTVTRQSNGDLVINNYDYMTLQVVNTYTVTP